MNLSLLLIYGKTVGQIDFPSFVDIQTGLMKRKTLGTWDQQIILYFYNYSRTMPYKVSTSSQQYIYFSVIRINSAFYKMINCIRETNYYYYS